MSVAIDREGKIVVAGYADNGVGGRGFAIARYAANGTLDAGFDGDGKVLTTFGANAGASDVAILPSGRIVAGGHVRSASGAYDFAVARYLPGGLADLDGDGVADAVDNCPFAANAGQADSDGDRTGDVCDVDIAPPAIGSLTLSANPIALGGLSTLQVTASDDWGVTGGQFTIDGDTPQSLSPPLSATLTGLATGVYTIEARVHDAAGNWSAPVSAILAVYDPSGGFVTGAGTIDSPAGAYAPDPALVGKARFGFVSQYRKGASTPSGKTDFEFKVGGFTFESSSYQWLVVSGPKAQYKGSGTVNGVGSYGFLLTATDSQLPGGGSTDRFRIKIWDSTTNLVVYDNVVGGSDDLDDASPQAMTAGNIVIHK